MFVSFDKINKPVNGKVKGKLKYDQFWYVFIVYTIYLYLYRSVNYYL